MDIQVTNGKVSFDTPMSFLTEISHDIHSEFVVWDVYCFTIFTSNNSWWPPTYMLQVTKRPQITI